MSELKRGHDHRWAALVITLVLLLPLAAGAQTPPSEPPPAGQAAPSSTPEQAPPPPAAPAPPKVTYPTVLPTRDIKLTEHFAIRFGLQAQVWYELLQDSIEEAESGDQAYAINFFCKRCRILASVQPWDNITLNLVIEATSLGRGTGSAAAFNKNFAPNFSVLDAFAEIKFSDALILSPGLQLIPFARNVVQGTTTYIGLDVNFTSAQHINAVQTTVLRDVGLVLRGYVLDQKLGYRVGVFSGVRDAPVQPAMMPLQNTASENAPLLAAYLQYNILDVDKGYVYNGCYYGRKRIAGVSAGAFYQQGEGDDVDPAMAFSAAAFLAYPISGVNKAGADEVHALAQFAYYDGGGEPGMLNGTAPSLRKQTDFAVEAGYYNKGTKLSVFGGFEGRFISEEEDKAIVPSQIWFGGGLKYHLVDNLLNFTLAFKRSQYQDLAETSPLKDFNQIVLAAQAIYY